MRKIIAVILCVLTLSMSACSLLRENYLYRPSPFEMAVERVTTTTEDGTVTIGKVILSDLDVMRWIEAIEQAWRKRDQVAKGLEVSGAATESSLGFVSALLGFLDVLPYIGPVISAIGTVAKMVTSAINPKNRTEAYADGLKLISMAKSKYYATNRKQSDGIISIDKLTEAGATLQESGYCAISVVDNNLVGRQTQPC